MYQLIKTQSHGDKINRTKVVFEIPDGPTLEELLIEFRAFLLACGFEVPGEIMVQKEEDTSIIDI